MGFKERLRKAIDSKNITAYRVAKDTNLSISTIDRYINGTSSPDVEKASRLSSYLGVSIDWLVTGRGNMLEKVEKDKYPDNRGLFERLSAYINESDISVKEFEQSIGVNYVELAYPEDIIETNTIKKISKKYPNLNINWLITGEGKMLKENGIDNSNMNKGVTKRIVDIMNAESVSIDTFANKLKIPDTVIKSMLYHQTTPSYEQIMRISKAYPCYDLNWLITGEGKMLKDEDEANIPHVEVPSIGIPHIESVEAYCGPGQGFDVSIMRKECPLYNIPGMDGVEFTIRAKGRSMINREYPDRSVKEGDYIGCIKCRSGAIRYGEVYALSTSEGVMVKVIQESDREGYVLLESFNREEGFKSFYYPVIDIHDMALVVAVASINRWA